MTEVTERKKRMITYNPLNIKNYNPFIYPVPPPGDALDDIECVPLSKNWFTTVMGALQILTWQDAYSGTLQEKQSAATEAHKLIGLMMTREGCNMRFRNHPTDECLVQSSEDGGITWIDAWRTDLCLVPSTTRIYRYNTVNNYHYEVSTDDGETWEDASAIDFRNIEPQVPAPVGPDAACGAALAFVAYWETTIADILEFISTGATFAAILAAVAAAISVFLTGGAAISVAIPLVTLLISVISGGLQSEFDEEFWDWLKCEVFLQFSVIDMTLGKWVTGVVYDALIGTLRARGDTPAQVLELVIALLGPSGIANAAATGEAEDGETCDTCDNWGHEYLSGDGRLPLDTVVLGSYNAVDDRYEQVFEPAQVRMSVQVNINFPQETNIRRIQATIDSLIHDEFSERQNKIYYINTSQALVQVASQPITTSGIYNLDTGQINVQAIGIVFEFFGRHVNNQTDHHWFTYAAVFGVGFDPFVP